MRATYFTSGIITVILVVVGICFLYIKGIPHILSADNKKQRIKLLTYEEIISWAAKIVTKNNYHNLEGLKLNIIPPYLVKNLPSNSGINIPDFRKDNCIILLIEDKNDVLLYKTIFPFELSQSLKDILPEDRIYVQLIKTK